MRTDDEPDLVLIQAYIRNAYRAKGVFAGLGTLPEVRSGELVKIEERV
jgi:hypothetical protein